MTISLRFNPRTYRWNIHMSCFMMAVSRVEWSSTHARIPPRQSHSLFPGSRFRASKAAQSRRGATKIELPPGPPLAPVRYEKRLHMFGGSGCCGLLGFPLCSGSIPRKIAARVPLQVSMQPQCPFKSKLTSSLHRHRFLHIETDATHTDGVHFYCSGTFTGSKNIRKNVAKLPR